MKHYLTGVYPVKLRSIIYTGQLKLSRLGGEWLVENGIRAFQF